MSMKKSLMWVGILALAVTLFAWAGAPVANAAPPQQDSDPRTITVTGVGTAYGAPDIVTVGLGVESVNSDVKTAMDETNSRMNAIIAALQENGVAREDIRTEYFSIYQDYSGGPMVADGPDTRSYRVSTSATITVREVGRVSDLLAAAVDAGANVVNYIQFDIENRDALQADARSLAVNDAQARAADLAGLMGMTVGAPLSITENSDMYGPVRMGGGGGGGIAYAESASISEGQLSVNMSVTITFELVSAN